MRQLRFTRLLENKILLACGMCMPRRPNGWRCACGHGLWPQRARPLLRRRIQFTTTYSCSAARSLYKPSHVNLLCSTPHEKLHQARHLGAQQLHTCFLQLVVLLQESQTQRFPNPFIRMDIPVVGGPCLSGVLVGRATV